MALPTIGDGEQVGDGNPNETLVVGGVAQGVQVGRGAATVQLGVSGATVKVGVTGATMQFMGVTAAAHVTAILSAATASFSSTAHANAAIDAINSILTALQNAGIMASS